eukprot:EG_transcript_4700
MRLSRPRWLLLQCAACFAAGVASCFLMNHISAAPPDTPPARIMTHHATQTSLCPADEPEEPSQTLGLPTPLAPAAANCACPANGTSSASSGRTAAEMAAWQAELERQAVPCRDDIVKRRMGVAMMSNVLGQCALRWLGLHAETELHPNKPQVLFDYTYDAMDYPFNDAKFKDWLQLLSFLPQDSLAMPDRKGATPNQILLGTPILHRLRAWFATSTFVDVQLALRFDEMATYATPIDPLELIAKIASMGRTTYVVLSCTPFSDMTDVDAVQEALRRHADPATPLGIRLLAARVEVLAVFKYQTCTKPLLRVTTDRLEKVGRAKWCYYPTPHYGWFRMSLRDGQLTMTDSATGKVVQHQHESKRPYVPLSEILGWGVVRDTREYWFGSFASHKVCDSMAMHNVVLLAGGILGCRPSPIHLDDVVTRPTGKNYLVYLQILTCTGHGQRWRLQYWANTTRLAYYTTSGPTELKFANDTLYRASHGGWKLAPNVEQQAAQFQDDGGRPICGSECLQCFGNFTTIEEPAPECGGCFRCLAREKQNHFLARSFVGCNDVDGVAENGVAQAHGDRCYDTQRRALPRPTAPDSLL